jgi:hypothetical protein
VLRALREGAVDVVVGTQMVSKGHYFPGVRLVGVVLADLGLHLPDFRAAERTFQLLSQVAGRALASGPWRSVMNSRVWLGGGSRSVCTPGARPGPAAGSATIAREGSRPA